MSQVLPKLCFLLLVDFYIDSSSKQTKLFKLKINSEGGSPGLVVMGGDSCSEGREFQSKHHILDGHFHIPICCKICNVCFKR